MWHCREKHDSIALKVETGSFMYCLSVHTTNTSIGVIICYCDSEINSTAPRRVDDIHRISITSAVSITEIILHSRYLAGINI